MNLISDLPQKTTSKLVDLLAMAQAKITEHEITIAENNQENKKLLAIIASLEQRNAMLLQERYGSRSEKFENSHQASLFDEARVDAIEIPAIEAAEAEIQVAGFTRKKAGRKPLPAHLPREEVIYDLPEDEKHCACGCALTEIGADKSEQLEIIPAQFKVIVHVRKKYACKSCENTVKTAALPAMPIPKSIATASLLAHVMVCKYEDHLPLYRQEHILQRSGVDIARSTLSHWMIQCAALLKPLVDQMASLIKCYDVAYADETTVQVLKEAGRAAESESFMWYFAGGPPDKQCVVYEYHPTRAGRVAHQFFTGYQGYLHCDGYAGYDALFTQGKLIGVGCWAHARRKFAAIAKSNKKNPGFAQEVLNRLQKVYHLEKIAKENAYTLEQIQAMRNEKSQVILLDLKTRLDHKITQAPPGSPIAAAMQYTLNQWPKLMGYLKDPRLDIDNNASERAIKNFAIGRKNWLFSDSIEGVKAGAIIYSLMESCKLHGVEPYLYFKTVLAAIPTTAVHDLEKLLPFKFSKNQLLEQIR